jgi:hypothetical protein
MRSREFTINVPISITINDDGDPQDIQWNQYEVYPEDNGYDLPKNPYSPV